MADKERVLVVDDNAMSRELAHDLLEDAGYDVRDAATTQEAITALSDFSPHVVLLDWHLKGATGGDVLKAIREPAAAAPSVRVLVVTADIRLELREAALTAGADDVITKPYRASVLEAAVAGALAAGSREGV